MSTAKLSRDGQISLAEGDNLLVGGHNALSTQRLHLLDDWQFTSGDIYALFVIPFRQENDFQAERCYQATLRRKFG